MTDLIHAVEDFRDRFDANQHPTFVVDAINTTVLYANPAFWSEIKFNQIEEPIERLSDVVKKTALSEVRNYMLEALKDERTPLTVELDLRDKLFAPETQRASLSVIHFEEDDFILVEFLPPEGLPEEVPDTKGMKMKELRARIASLQKSVNKHDAHYYRFVHAVGHELKSPITAIKGFSELLEYQLAGTDDTDTKEILSMIVRMSDRLLAYIDQFYHVSEQDLQSLRYKAADVQTILESVRDELSADASKHQIQFGFDEIRLRLKLNPTILRELLYQLCSIELIHSKQEAKSLFLKYHAGPTEHVLALFVDEAEHADFPIELYELQPQEPIDDENIGTTTNLGFEMAKRFVPKIGGTIRMVWREGNLPLYFITLPK